MRWVFSPRGFTDEDGNSLVAGNCEVRWCSLAFSGNSAEFVRDGVSRAGRRWGELQRISCYPAVTMLGSAVPMAGQRKDKYARRQEKRTEGSGLLRLPPQQGNHDGINDRLRDLFI
jgi:hypothetical protein